MSRYDHYRRFGRSVSSGNIFEVVADPSRQMELLYSELYEAAGMSRRLGETMAAQEGCSQNQWQTMWAIDSTSLTVPQIARRLGVTRQNTQRVAADLVRLGLVDLVPNPDHKTSPLVRLTSLGRSTLGRLNSNAARWHAMIMEDFTVGQVAALRALLRKFVAANEGIDVSP